MTAEHIAQVRATLEEVAQKYDMAGHWGEYAKQVAAALREAATWAPPVSESATREALIAMQAAAEEVFARYIGGSPVEGKLGDAIDLLATASTQARKALRAAPPGDEGLRAAAERVVACPCLAGASCHALDALADLLAAVSPLPQKEQRDERGDASALGVDQEKSTASTTAQEGESVA